MRLRAGDLRTPSRSIRVPARGGFDLLDRCRPYVELTSHAVISHLTAAQIHGFDLPARFEALETVHLARQRGLGVPRRKHVTGHRLRLDEEDVVVMQDVPVTSMQRTWLDLANLLTEEELVVAADQLVSQHMRSFGRPRIAKVPMADLADYIKNKKSVMGLAKARDALRLVRVGVDSPPETRVRLILQRAGLPEFIPNHPICDELGDPQVWVDLGCTEYQSCIEYEGSHHLTPEQQILDHDRDYKTQMLKWHQAKINKADMNRGERWVVAKATRSLAAGGWAGE